MRTRDATKTELAWEDLSTRWSEPLYVGIILDWDIPAHEAISRDNLYIIIISYKWDNRNAYV